MYDWELDIIPGSDIQYYTEVANLSSVYADMNADMQAVTVSIATTLAARLSAAVQVVISDSSTPSKSEISQNASQQLQGSENYDAENSVVEISDDDIFETRKGSRARNRVSRYEDSGYQKKSRTNKRPGKDAQTAAWDVAIAEWESLTLEKYQKRKSEKIKTLLTKIENLKKGKMTLPKRQSSELYNKEKEKNVDLERAKNEHEKLLHDIKILKQKEEDYKYREQLRARADYQNRQTPQNDKININTKKDDNESSVDKTASEMVNILKAASKLRHEFYKSDKIKLKQDKTLSRKQNEFAVNEMGHQTEMATMHANHNASIQRFQSDFVYRERRSEQRYSRDFHSHMQAPWSNSSRSDYRSNDNRSREFYTPRTSYDKRSHEFYSLDEDSARRSRGSSPERCYSVNQRVRSREDTKIRDQRMQDTYFEDQQNRRRSDVEDRRSRASFSRPEQGSRSDDSYSHYESSHIRSSHEQHGDAQQRRREEHIDQSYSRSDSKYYDKITPHRSSSSKQGNHSDNSRSSHYERDRRSREHNELYQQRRDERMEYESKLSSAYYESGEESEFNDNEEYNY